MIPAGVQAFVAFEPVDMRSGFERLAGRVRERVGYEARSGALFVFVGKRPGRTTQRLSKAITRTRTFSSLLHA